LSGFGLFETILALEIEVVEGGTELQKEKQSWCWQKQNSNN
jgi:hypothetical protein